MPITVELQRFEHLCSAFYGLKDDLVAFEVCVEACMKDRSLKPIVVELRRFEHLCSAFYDLRDDFAALEACMDSCLEDGWEVPVVAPRRDAPPLAQAPAPAQGGQSGLRNGRSESRREQAAERAERLRAEREAVKVANELPLQWPAGLEPHLCLCGKEDVLMGLTPSASDPGSCPALDLWPCEPPPLVVHSSLECAMLEGKLYVCGSHCGPRLRMMQRYDPIKDVWEPLPRMKIWRLDLGLVAADGCIYVCGGETQAGFTVLRSVERLIPKLQGAKARWETLPVSMQARRQSLAVSCLQTPDGERIAACGGSSSPELQRRVGPPDLNSVEIFDPRGGPAWQWLPPMLTHRSGHCAAAAPSGLLVCGGICSCFPALSTCEHSDQRTQVWSALPPMSIGRTQAKALAVNGEIFVLGGWRGPDGPQAPVLEHTAEHFNTELGAWELVKPRNEPPTKGPWNQFCVRAPWA